MHTTGTEPVAASLTEKRGIRYPDEQAACDGDVRRQRSCPNIPERIISLLPTLRSAVSLISLSPRHMVAGAVCLSVAALAAAGCAQQQSAENGPASAEASASPAAASASPSTTAAGTPVTLKVGLLTPGKITDKGWSESASDGLQKIKSELHVDTTPPVEGPIAQADVPGILRNLSQQGDNLVFLHGSEWDDAAKSVAPSTPNTTYVVMGGRSVDSPNLYPIQFNADQATYLAGMVAGGITKTNKIGLVGATKIPIVVEAFQAFKKGVTAVNPKATVTEVYIGSEDIAKAKQQTQQLLDAGDDVIMHNANEGGKGVADAVKAKPGAVFIGANADQSDLAPTQTVGSFILDVPSAMLAVAKSVQTGDHGGKAFAAGLKDGAVDFKYNARFQGTVPPALKLKVDGARAAMIAGKLDPTK